MGWAEDMERLTEQASQIEAPAQVRSFAKRYRNLYVAMLQEGFSIQEISQLTGIALVIHLNGPDLPEEESPPA